MNAGDVISRMVMDVSGVGAGLSNAEQQLNGFGGKMKKAGAAMSLALSAPLAAAKGYIVSQTLESMSATSQLRAQLGLTADEAANLGTVAKTTWSSGFGESITEATEAVSQVRHNMGELADKELEQVSKGAMMLSRVFQADVGESTAAAGVLMKNFKISAQDSFDLITTGFQQGGDYSGELLDTLREYSPQFSTMGMSADQMLGILIAGAKEGAWNLDKVGDAVKEFNIRAKDGSKTTVDGFAAIGLNAKQMGAAIAEGGEKGQQAFTATLAALAAMEDPVKRNVAGVALFGTQWEDLESKVVVAMAEGAKGVEGFQGSTEKAMKSLEENNPAMAMKQSVRELTSSVEPALRPIVSIINDDVIPAAKSVTKWFTDLGPAGQKAALGIAALVLVSGPATAGLGAVAGGASKVITMLGKFRGASIAASVATQGITTATTTATGVGGLAGLGTSLGATAIAAGPWLLASAAIVGTGYAIHKKMSQDVIPAVNLFGDSVSEGTKKAVEGYLTLDTDAQKSLTNLYTNSTTITAQITTDMVSKYASMATQIKAGMDTHHQQQLADLQAFFASSNALTDEEEATALSKLQADNATKKTEMDAHVKRIQEILTTASANNRTLTLEEQQEINTIQEQMKLNAVKALSEQEVESAAILEKMKAYGNRITAEQASEVIKNANTQRDQAVAAANQQYDETVRNIIRMRDESKIITADQAEKMIADAERQKTESITKAEELRAGVVGKLEETHKGILDQVSDADGSIKNGWTKLVEWFTQNPIIRRITTVVSNADAGGVEDEDQNAAGTPSFRGGLTYLHERGYELYDLPTGTRIYNHDASKALVKELAESIANRANIENPAVLGAAVSNITIVNEGIVVGSNGMDELASIISRKIGREYGLGTGGAW